MAVAYDATDGQNPNYGADINYYLKSAPTGDINLSILDAAGKTVRSLRATKDAGINRVWWDLRYAPLPSAILHTSPIYASWMKVPEKGRPTGGRMTLLASPGKYMVKLTVYHSSYNLLLTHEDKLYQGAVYQRDINRLYVRPKRKTPISNDQRICVTHATKQRIDSRIKNAGL